VGWKPKPLQDDQQNEGNVGTTHDWFCNVAVPPFGEVVSPVGHGDNIDESVVKS